MKRTMRVVVGALLWTLALSVGGLLWPAAPARAQNGPMLSLDKAGTPDPAAAGGQLTYTLTYDNSGDVDATGTTLVDPIPANTSFVSATGSPTLLGNLVIWDLGTVAMGTTGSVTLVVQVASPLPNGTVIENSATLSSTETEPVAATSQNTVTSAPALGLAKSASPEPVPSGGLLTFTLSYANTGSDQATGAVLTDPLPPHTTFAAASGGGSYDAGTNTVTWSLGTIPAGASGAVTLNVLVASSTTSGTMIENTATLAADGQQPLTASSSSTVAGQPISQVPAVSGPGLALLAALLAAAGWLRLRAGG